MECYEKRNIKLQSENLLERYHAECFIEFAQIITTEEELDNEFMLKVFDHIKVFENGMLCVVFWDGTEIEKN